MSVDSCIHFYAVSLKYVDTNVSISLAYTTDIVSFSLDNFSVLKNLRIRAWHIYNVPRFWEKLIISKYAIISRTKGIREKNNAHLFLSLTCHFYICLLTDLKMLFCEVFICKISSHYSQNLMYLG